MCQQCETEYMWKKMYVAAATLDEEQDSSSSTLEAEIVHSENSV